MLGKSPDQNQMNLFRGTLIEFINLEHPLVILTDKIPWDKLEKEFSGFYSHTGQPSKPVRFMAGLLILKQMYDLGDETIMYDWVRNLYFQYFCGESEFRAMMISVIMLEGKGKMHRKRRFIFKQGNPQSREIET